MESFNSGESRTIFRNISSVVIIGRTTSGRKAWQEEEETRKDTSIVLIRQEHFLTLELFKVIQGRNPNDPSLQDNVLIPDNVFEYIYHVGCAINLHSITNSGLTARGQNSSIDRQTVFFAAVNPMDKDHKDPYELDLTKPRLASYKEKKWKRHQDTSTKRIEVLSIKM